MITSEELENFDIFPKEYSFSCLFKFILYTLSSMFSFLILYAFYNDKDIYSILTLNTKSRFQDIIINDFLTNQLIELNPKDFLSENKTNFIQTYDDINEIFMKEYIINSYPCLIKNSTNYFRLNEIMGIIENDLIKNRDRRIIFEYRENPYIQFYDEDYQYLRTTYITYLNLTKNISSDKNYYFLNEYSILDILKNITDFSCDNYLKNNDLVKNLELKDIYLSKVENFVLIWGHMEVFDEFICLESGNLEFILIPPQEKKYMYPFTRRSIINYSRVNFFDGRNNVIENYPDFFKSNKVYINLSGGECIYIPAFWWRSYRTNKRKKVKTNFLTFKFNSNSKYLENLMYMRNQF